MLRSNKNCHQISQRHKRIEYGNAIVEFIGIIIVIIGPALILLMGLGSVMGAQFGVEAAARDAVRQLARCSDDHCQEQAENWAHDIWESRGRNEAIEVTISCSTVPCQSPGTTISVTVATRVVIPSLGYEVPVSATYSMLSDPFRSHHG